MFADHLAIIHRFEIETISLLDEDVEVIAPKFDHHFIELALAIELADERGLTQFIRNGFAVVAIEELIADTFEFVGFHVESFEG